GRNDEATPSTHPHARDTVLPTPDQSPQREFDGLAAIPGAVELLTGVVFDTDIVHSHRPARHRLCAVADHHVVDDQIGRCGAIWKFNLGFRRHDGLRYAPIALSPTAATGTLDP